MRRAGSARSWPRVGRKAVQKGQALIYGIFFLMIGLASLFFLFNTGQLTREKTKLVNTTDAVAYSAGVMHARILNFDAYTNRAMVANTVAIAQLTSLSSWVQHTDNMASFGWVLNNPKFALYYPAYFAAQTFGPTANSSLVQSGALGDLARTSDKIILALAAAQQAAYLGLLPARKEVMDEVARANYRDDGTVIVDDVPLTGTEFTSFVSRYAGDDRKRFAEVAKTSANRDPFVRRRSWDLPALWSDCLSATLSGRFDWLDRRGGTEMIGYDEWKAVDTLSEKRWVPKNKTDVMCMGLASDPVAWGAQTAADNATIDLDPSHYDWALPTNPDSFGLAVATAASDWGYSGLPRFYDLSDAVLKAAEDPRLKFAIRLRREKSQTLTSGSRSAMLPSPRLNAYTANAASDVYTAVAASEVYFERPIDVRNNVYGESIGKPHEIGSLFNPYWQVRLMTPSDAALTAAQALQGVFVPMPK